MRTVAAFLVAFLFYCVAVRVVLRILRQDEPGWLRLGHVRYTDDGSKYFVAGKRV